MVTAAALPVTQIEGHGGHVESHTAQLTCVKGQQGSLQRLVVLVEVTGGQVCGLQLQKCRVSEPLVRSRNCKSDIRELEGWGCVCGCVYIGNEAGRWL